MFSNIEDLASSILDFQGNMVRVAYRRKTMPVDPVANATHGAVLSYIWAASKLTEEVVVLSGPGQQRGARDVRKWRRIGFGSEDLRAEFERVGLLGLECLVSYPACYADFPFRLVPAQLCE